MGRFILVIALLAAPAWGAIDVYRFDTPQQEVLFHELTRELRCPKCQNNNIADSNAELSKDLRDKTYQMVRAGESKQAVLDYMVARYGNFVRYDPPMTPAVVLLMAAPFVVLGLGLFWLVRLSRRRAVPTPLTLEQQARLAQMTATDEGARHD
jgi:cytochrome c-type biogenesis protein CcmH